MNRNLQTQGGPASGKEPSTGPGPQQGREEGSRARKGPHPWARWLKLDWTDGRARTDEGTLCTVTRVGGAHEGTLIQYRWTVRTNRGDTQTGLEVSDLAAMKEAEAVARDLDREAAIDEPSDGRMPSGPTTGDIVHRQAQARELKR